MCKSIMQHVRVRNAQRVVLQLTSPKKVLAFIGSGLTLLAFARVAVLIVESYSTVWSERRADHELIILCDSGSGSLSADFRALCLRKRAEQSAPILLKALLRACATAFTDFAESFSSPTKIVLLILFALTGVAAPVVKAAMTLLLNNLRQRRRRGRSGRNYDATSDDESDEENDHHEIVVVETDQQPAQAFATHLRQRVRQLGRRVSHSPARSRPTLELGRFEDC